MKAITLIAAALSLSAIARVEVPKLPEPDKPLDQMTTDERKAYAEKRKEALAKFSPEQKEVYREANRVRRIAESGGLVRKANGSIGRIVIANLQNEISDEDIHGATRRMMDFVKVNLSVEKMDAEFAASPENAIAQTKAQALILVVDNTTDPSLLVAPEARWAKVNVGKLKDKNAVTRTKAEILRAFAFLCGGASSQFPNPMTGFIGDPAQIDELSTTELPMDVIGRFRNYLGQMGITPYVEKTYLKACQEGWAPPPTNDVQKTIWNEVHTIPDKPMKITFDPAAKKGKVTQ